ncbi:hypothetical protein [Haloplanus rubicundus]|nr:hypothetical protein [Haloplanus rubicundus]
MATESNARPRHAGPRSAALGDRIRPADVALLGSVPVTLGLVSLLPRATRRSLVFDYAAPTLPTAFASAFVHLDPVHLLVNVVLYALLAATSLALDLASGHRRRFYTAFPTFVLVFPVVLSYLNLAVPRSATTLGFSGVAMAFVGYLPLALADYLDARFGIGPATQLAPALFLSSLALVAVLSVRSAFALVGDRATLLALAASLGALRYALVVAERSDLRARCRRLLGTPGAVELTAVAAALVFAVPFVAFPASPERGAGVLNLYSHLLGYALGFLVPFVTVSARRFVAGS